MSRSARTLVIVVAVLAAPAVACSILLGSSDVPTPDDAGEDATMDGGNGGGDARGDARPNEGGSEASGDGGGDSGADSCAPAASLRCEGKQPEVCSATGLWLEAGAPCSFVCDDGGCTGVCSPTSGRCVGLTPQACTAEGQWEAGADCPFLCDGGSCFGSCTPSTVQCGTGPAGDAAVGDASGPVGSIDTCSPGGQWQVSQCTQPTPDCTPGGGTPACACTGAMCGAACAHLPTDPLNCGVCGHDCLGGACVGGSCQPFALATNQPNPNDIAIDLGNAYWVNDVVAGTVNACALTGCNNTPTVLASAQNMPAGLTVVGGTVYWVNYGTGGTGGSVLECPTSGCPVAGPTVITTGQTAPLNIAIASNGNAYWTAQPGVMKCGLSSLPCTPTMLGPAGIDIVVDANNAYWTAAAGPVRCALGGCGGAPTAIATNQLSAWAIAVDSTNVYWTDLSGFTVDRCGIGGGCAGNPTKIANATRPNDVVVDGTTVYWVDPSLGTVSSCAISGCGAPTVLASYPSGSNPGPTALAVDATAIYWVNGNPGAVMKLAK